MKKILSLALAALMIVGCLAAFASCGQKTDTPSDNSEEKKTLNVYTNAGFAPYEYVNEKGEVVGIDIDVVKAIGEKLGYNVVINDIEFNQILVEVQKDKLAVGAAGMSKKPDRDAVALASEIYATSIQYVIAPVGAFAEGEVVTNAALVAYAAGGAIGVQKGTTGADLVAEAIDGSDVQVMEYANAIVASNDIGTNVKAVVIDKMPAQAISGDKADLACWQLDAEPESYVMYFNKEATDLVAEVNKLLTTMIADGTIDQYTVNHSTGK